MRVWKMSTQNLPCLAVHDCMSGTQQLSSMLPLDNNNIYLFIDKSKKVNCETMSKGCETAEGGLSETAQSLLTCFGIEPVEGTGGSQRRGAFKEGFSIQGNRPSRP